MNKPVLRAAALVAAVYVYFLLFAEFAFLELVRPVTGDGERLRLVMAGLGAGGALGSVLGAWGFDRHAWGRHLARWLVACALAAGLAVVAPFAGVSGLAVAGLAVGLALGGATVCLASGLRAISGGGARLGWVAGLGTGLAYACCNLPVVFQSSPVTQSLLAGLVVLATARLARDIDAREATRHTEPLAAPGVRPFAWTLVFLALVWMDSAAFYIIQHTDSLRAETWQGAWTLWGNAAMHLGAALLAGWALDRGRAGLVTLAAALLLAAACNWITDTGGELLYVAGVSLYSTALVFVAALSGRARVAALIFAVAGWGGSALGIGMAQDLHRIPAWFAPAALVVVLAGLLLARRPARGAAHLALALGVGAAALPPAARAEDDAAIARGRDVYLAEGCIHCHSQYVRPHTGDVLRWGPARPLDELLKETPPLFGNRRQGPDLLNVGNRRNPDWNRLHLIAPSLVSPGSRMPSYARLFAPGETRGEDLLSYLQSLGAGTETERAATIAQWSPAPEAIHTATTPAGAALFARLCVQCHGPSGRGDGPAAARLQAKVADLSAPGMDRDETRLARLILFGRPGTAMAGHETLADRDVVSLARYVATLQARSLPNENPGG